MDGPVIITGRLGWGNRKSGYEAYGPGGRWGQRDDGSTVGIPNGQLRSDGDLLGDALERAGCVERSRLIVIAVPPSANKRDQAAEIARTVASALDIDITEV